MNELTLVVEAAKAMGAMTPIAKAAKAVKEKHAFVPTGIPCRDTGKVHMFLKASCGQGAMSIGSVCPTCRISLHDHGQAIGKQPIDLG